MENGERIFCVFKLSLYLLPKFSRVPFTIVLRSGISTMVNGTLLNFGKRYRDDLRVIFDQWQNLHLGLDALNNQKILKRYLKYGFCKKYFDRNEPLHFCPPKRRTKVFNRSEVHFYRSNFLTKSIF
jgi:hypothetical protein